MPRSVIEVAIANEQSSLQFDADRIRCVVEQILSDSGVSRAAISVAIVGDTTMHRLNRQFLQHDYTTDVLSFVLEKDEDHLDGEIIANADYAASSALQFNWPAQHELLLYVIHGTLHLVGYDDQDDASQLEMRSRERHYLELSGITLPN